MPAHASCGSVLHPDAKHQAESQTHAMCNSRSHACKRVRRCAHRIRTRTQRAHSTDTTVTTHAAKFPAPPSTPAARRGASLVWPPRQQSDDLARSLLDPVTQVATLHITTQPHTHTPLHTSPRNIVLKMATILGCSHHQQRSSWMRLLWLAGDAGGRTCW